MWLILPDSPSRLFEGRSFGYREAVCRFPAEFLSWSCCKSFLSPQFGSGDLMTSFLSLNKPLSSQTAVEADIVISRAVWRNTTIFSQLWTIPKTQRGPTNPRQSLNRWIKQPILNSMVGWPVTPRKHSDACALIWASLGHSVESICKPANHDPRYRTISLRKQHQIIVNYYRNKCRWGHSWPLILQSPPA